MQTYDLIMLAVLAGAALFGYWKGLAWQVASLGSILLSYFVALNFRGLISSKLGLEPPLDTAVSMLILYVGSSLAVWIAFGFVSKSLKEMKLKDWDHQIGALVGAAKGVLFCMLITVFAMTLGPANWREIIPKSTSGRYIAAALTKTEALLPKDIHQSIAKYIEPVKSQLQSGQGDAILADGDGGAGEGLLENIEKAGSGFWTNTKRKIGDGVQSELESRVKQGAEGIMGDVGKSEVGQSIAEKLTGSRPSASPSVGESTPREGSQNDPDLGSTSLSPLGVPRAENAARPSVRMPDFSSKRWQRK
jgi:membrane protein required for colicin V production